LNRVERTALVSVGINTGLVILKVVLASVSGSLALIADAWHSGSDIAASGLVWAGARISRRGERGGLALALAENIIALVIGALILWAAVGIFQRVSAAAAATITNLPIAIGGSLAAAFISYYAAQYKLHVGEETGSLSLSADGQHSRTDTFTTGAVIVGLMGHAMGLELDRIAAAVVAIFVVESGLAILLAAGRGLHAGRATQSVIAARLAGSTPGRWAVRLVHWTWLPAAWRALRSLFVVPERRRRLLEAAVAAVVILWVLSSVYFVGPGRVGVVRRWGRALPEQAQPGLNWKAPWPIDRVTRVDVPLIRRIEIGFETRGTRAAVNEAAVRFYDALWESRHEAGTYEKRPEEALRLTGDENIVDMNVTVFYHVSSPRDYLFDVAGAGALAKQIAESVITQTVGSLAIEEVLTARRDSLEHLLADGTQVVLDASRTGISIDGVRLQDMHPPLEVVPSFRDVSSAREDKNRIINEALAYEAETVPKARGDAEKLIREAEGYKSERVDHARGDADRFVALAAEYKKAKAVTETRLYIETMETLLTNVEKFIVSSDVDLEGYDIRMFDKSLGAAVESGK
jgi:membrane protease subunit HflK